MLCICYNTQRVRYIFEIFRSCNRTNDDRTSIDRFWFRFDATRWPSNRIPSSSLYIPAEYPVQFLFITLTTIPSILRNVVLSNFQFIPDNIRVVSLWYSEEVCNSPTVSNVRSPPKCGSLCNTINDIGKSRYQQCSWTIGFRFDSRLANYSIFESSFSFFFYFFFVNFTTSKTSGINASILTDLLLSLYIKNRRKFFFIEIFFEFFLNSLSLSFSFFSFPRSLTRKRTTIRYCSLMYKYIRV